MGDIWNVLSALSAAHDAVMRAQREEKERRYNSPEAKAARSERSRKAVATRRENREAEQARENELLDRIPTGPACDAFGIVLQAQEVNCVRRPHKHGDHEDAYGSTWPSYEGEYDEMLKMTTDNLRALLADVGENPVLYVARDEDTGEPVRLQVWVEAYVPDGDIVVRKHELVDALGGPDHPDGVTNDALEHLLENFQAEVDAMEEASEVPDDVPMDTEK